jgi:hypothetical protein
MTDTAYEAFRNKLIADDLVFADEGLSVASLKMNQWRYEHLLAMAKVAAAGSDKVTLDGDFQSGEMMAFLDERFKLANAGLFELEDLFDALTSLDPSYSSAPNANVAEFSVDDYSKSLEASIGQNTQAKPWRENESSLKVTKTAFPGAAPEIPLPPDLRK